MHFHFPFNTLQVLWTLTFAAHLVLLVVLMGRDRVARFRWFTASVVIVAFRLLTSRLLYGRIPQVAMAEVFIVLANLGALVGLMVVVELSRLAFGRAPRRTWVAGALTVIIAGALVLAFWGAWPAWKTLAAEPPMQLLQLIAQKASLLVDVETVLVGLLIVLFGYRFGAGWRTHTQRLAIGLSTASMSQLSLQVIWEIIARTTVAHNVAEYTRIIGIRERLFNANNTLYIAVLVWWIVTLWINEPGASEASPQANANVIDAPASEVPDSTQSDALESGESPAGEPGSLPD